MLVTLTLLLHALPVSAHPAKVGFADITIGRTQVELTLSLNLFELDLLLSLDRDVDAQVEPAELEARAVEIRNYLRDKVQVSVGKERLLMEVLSIDIGRSADGKATFEAALIFRSEHPLTQALAVQCEPLTELGEGHRIIAKIARDGREEQFVFRKGEVYRGQPRPFWSYAVQFLGLGIHHIFFGYDHIAFLLGLLLMGGRLLNMVKIVTAFTLAHSVTLALAALEFVTLPVRLVEAGIALSIVYVALENLFARNFERRWLVSFFFGFIHGFGFANVLLEMDLARTGLISSLFFFNLGVEIGQVAIVFIVLPCLWLLWEKTRFHAAVAKFASVVIFCAGGWWFYMRALWG